jgi:hypothetical protein
MKEGEMSGEVARNQNFSRKTLMEDITLNT